MRLPAQTHRLVRLLPAVAVLLAGCVMEQIKYPYLVVNYSPNVYIVQMTYKDGVVADLSVAPGSRTGQERPSPAVRALVYEGGCSNEVATLQSDAGIGWILIDKSGNVSAPEMMNQLDVTAVPYQELPVPSSCP